MFLGGPHIREPPPSRISVAEEEPLLQGTALDKVSLVAGQYLRLDLVVFGRFHWLPRDYEAAGDTLLDSKGAGELGCFLQREG